MSKFQFELKNIELSSAQQEIINSSLKAKLLKELQRSDIGELGNFDLEDLREKIDGNGFILGIKIQNP